MCDKVEIGRPIDENDSPGNRYRRELNFVSVQLFGPSMLMFHRAGFAGRAYNVASRLHLPASAIARRAALFSDSRRPPKFGDALRGAKSFTGPVEADASAHSHASATAAVAPGPSVQGVFGRAQALVREYGAYAVGIYATLWVTPLVGVYAACVVCDNFGYGDPGPLLASLGIKDWIYGLAGLPADARPAPWQVSAAWAYISAEVLEPVRFPLTLYLAPRLKRWVVGAAWPSSSNDSQTVPASSATNAQAPLGTPDNNASGRTGSST